jgi:hypothetical protein
MLGAALGVAIDGHGVAGRTVAIFAQTASLGNAAPHRRIGRATDDGERIARQAGLLARCVHSTCRVRIVYDGGIGTWRVDPREGVGRRIFGVLRAAGTTSVESNSGDH